MTTRVIVDTAEAYARALFPHLEHAGYRCDAPYERLLGKGCRTCDLEVLVPIARFQASGDLEAFERALGPHAKRGRK